MTAQSIAQSLNTVLINPLILALFATGLLLFVVGLIQFLYNINILGTSGDGREEGKRHMVWGLVGMFIMISAYSILNFLATNIGVSIK